MDLVHEALVKSWKTLREWVDGHRVELQCRDDVEAAAKVWEAAGRLEEGLPHGGQLAYYEKAQGEALSAEARAFLAQARHAGQRRLELQVRRQRRTIGVLAVVALVLLGLSGEAWRERKRAVAEREAT